MCHAIAQALGEFLHVWEFAGDRETLRLPDLAADGGQRIGKGRLLFAIPGCRPNRTAGARRKLSGEQRDQGEQAEQTGRGGGDGLFGPLPLALKAEVITHLAEGDLDRPALHEPADDAQRVLHQVSAQQRLRLELAERITQQYPTDWQRRVAAVKPHRGLRAELEAAFRRAIPVADCDRLPACAGIRQHLRQARQAVALLARPSLGAWLARWCRLVERR